MINTTREEEKEIAYSINESILMDTNDRVRRLEKGLEEVYKLLKVIKEK
jgi:hypothetical protein